MNRRGYLPRLLAARRLLCKRCARQDQAGEATATVSLRSCLWAATAADGGTAVNRPMTRKVAPLPRDFEVGHVLATEKTLMSEAGGLSPFIE